MSDNEDQVFNIKYEGHEFEAIKDGVKYKSIDGENWVPETEELKNAYEAGKMLQYQKENGEWVDFSKNTVCDDFKFQEHLNYRIKPAYDHKSFSDKKTDGKNWVSDSMCTEVSLTRRQPREYIKGILNAYGAEHLIDLPESMRLLVLQSLEEIIVNE